MRCVWIGKRELFRRILLVGMVLAGCQAELMSDELPSYQQVPELQGTVSSIGSDTLNGLMAHWAGAFHLIYPDVQFQIEGSGSATAEPAIERGIAQLGPISRKMKSEEEEAFAKKRGFKPTCLSVALDCVAVYVHKDNPVPGLTLAQVDSIFSKSHNSGLGDILTWGDAGLAGPWADVPITLYGRSPTSGTHAYFKQNALLKGEYKETLKEQPGSVAVVQSVASDRAGIGYSGIGYKTPGVRALPLAKTEDYPFIEPTLENSLAGTYPLGRTLYVYVAKRPGEPLPRVNTEFFKFVFSKEGQNVAVKAGFGALPHDVLAEQRQLLDD